MKNTIKVILFLIFISLQSWVKADDVRDFQIEGMSVGDSLLDFYPKNKLKKDYFYNSKKWASISLADKNFITYEGFQAHVKSEDQNYIIGHIEGMIIYDKNIEDCYSKQKEIILELDVLFKSSKKTEQNKTHSADYNSSTRGTYYRLNSGDLISVTCYDWSDNNKNNFVDKLGVSIITKEFMEWINIEAYK